jgi:hypothetical protein
MACSIHPNVPGGIADDRMSTCRTHRAETCNVWRKIGAVGAGAVKPSGRQIINTQLHSDARAFSKRLQAHNARGGWLTTKEFEMKKVLFAALALTALVASPALAQTTPDTGVWAASKARNAGDFARQPAYDAGAYAQVPVFPGTAYATPSPDAGLGGDYVGTDPDPNVQLELLKDAQSRE